MCYLLGSKFYSGMRLTCLGNVSGNSLNPSETANVVLLASDALNDSFCAVCAHIISQFSFNSLLNIL